MKGLRQLIKSRIPYEWEIVLRQEKKLTAFIEYVYRAQPKAYKGRYGYPKGKEAVIIGFAYNNIHEMFNTKDTKEGPIYWYSLHQKVQTLKYNYK